MSPLTFCEWLRDTWLSSALSESTWGFPIAGAIHILALALFGASLVLRLPTLQALRRIGVAALLVSGGVLFLIEPVRCYQSAGFRIKMVLLIAILTPRLPQHVLIALWAGVIIASRAIAFF